MIHVLGTGHSHMIGLEMFIRAGRLANVNAILNPNVLTSDGALRSSKLERISGIATSCLMTL
ncbi:SIS domain-containing protein [Candidatus Izimaplasma bacterium ZiA1]|uniref:SIS domain-containing protein n=1 Tax=Candidatus Izimoplasma sp. ZiA1 TaxID=2024899 RepID=UPI001F0B305E